MVATIGLGGSVMFWLDNWIGGSDRFSELFRLEKNKRCVVTERRANSVARESWVWDWIRRPSTDPAQVQLAHIQELIGDLSSSAPNDVWKWVGDVSGILRLVTLEKFLRLTEFRWISRPFHFSHGSSST